MSVLEAVARQRVVVLALVLGLWSPAWAAEPWRAVARVATSEDRSLLERVRGQSSDLPVILEAEAGPSMDASPGGAWREAERLASRKDARAVLWFTRDAAQLRVSVAAPRTGHLFVRSARVEGAPETLTWSVGAEALALAVRSALRAVDAGEPLGDVVAPPPPPPVVAAPPDLPAAADPGVEAPVTPVDGAFFQVGVHAALDGYHSWGQQGLSVGAGWAGRVLRLRAQVLAALPVHLRDAYADIRLTQGSALAWADVPFVKTGTWEGTVGLGAGVAGFWRRTEARAPDVEPTPSRLLAAFVVGPAVRVAWRVGPALALEAALSGEVLLGRPRLGYAAEGGFVLREDGASVRPRLGVGMVIFP
ncbi:hypothetical protein COCOR_01528 [Corallococcus coralloides DSM 2259]|uniref:Uncharacterized protein n=1 Tax=Corallococcus coralloides (strain ATCC 25202 / DSM 2259 / NBRC 100086 / M2) TaxID=1144275 RepID=H8MWV1_CORCM|nr:hypothetical protein [Corallococcus coralloides]AFE04129.1 hypothetical protein COCOR_01528 [Corallococcus coralloides DSM 2259]